MRRAFIPLLFASSLAAQQASIDGLAVNALTGEPLSGVHVRLITATFGGITGTYGAVSDRVGHFSIASIRPGTYVLAPECAGYLYVHSREATAAIPSLSVKPGQQLTGYKLEMTPRAVLAGKVVDENGDPVQGIAVNAVAVSPTAEPLMLMPIPNSGTDDRGEFRVIVAPGRYYLQTNGLPNQNPEHRSDGSITLPYAQTFYPSAVLKDRATPVDAIGGKEVGGLEIRLARQQQGLSISGMVSGITEETGHVFVTMQYGDSPQKMYASRSVPSTADGKFTAPGLQPGYYRISAYTQGGKALYVSQSVEMRLDGADPPPVSLTLSTGAELSGTLVMEGDAPGIASEKRTVRLNSASNSFNMMQPRGGETDGANAFRLEGIAPGKYRVAIMPLPENAYIKKVEVDGAPAPSDVIDIAGASRGLRVKVTISRSGAQISGRVLDPNGDKLLTPLAMVILMKDETDLTGAQEGGRATPDGKYSLKGVRPGKYHLFAVDAFSMPNQGGSDIFPSLYKNGEEIEIKEGDRITKDVRVFSKEVVSGKPKQ